MRRIVQLLSVLLLLSALPAFALGKHDDRDRDKDRRTVVDDVIRMTQSGVGEEEIVAFIHNERDRYVISADDVIAMTDAHVAKSVIRAYINDASDRADVDRDRDRRPVRSYYVAPAPYYGWYDPWYSPYWYDPFWYGPRFSIGVRFGGGRFYGGHRRW